MCVCVCVCVCVLLGYSCLVDPRAALGVWHLEQGSVFVDLTASISPQGTLPIFITNSVPIQSFQIAIVALSSGDGGGSSALSAVPVTSIQFNTPTEPDQEALLANGNNPQGWAGQREDRTGDEGIDTWHWLCLPYRLE